MRTKVKLFIQLFLICFTTNAQINYETLQESVQSSFKKKNDSSINEILNSSEKNIDYYWKAYLLLKKGEVLMINKDNKNAEEAINKGLELIGKKKEKNANDYFLLAMLKNTSLAFASYLKAPFISAKVTNYLEKGYSLDKNNPRYYLVSAINNYYTPSIFGGMSDKVETNLNNSIKLFTKEEKNINWGYDEAYIYLCKYYKKKKMFKKAKNTFLIGQKIFSNNGWFKKNKNKFLK